MTIWEIWKFPLEIIPIQRLSMPRVHRFLTVQVQAVPPVGDAVPRLWVDVDPYSSPEDVLIFCRGTGESLQQGTGAPDRLYLATVQLDGFVWHFFTEGAR